MLTTETPCTLPPLFSSPPLFPGQSFPQLVFSQVKSFPRSKFSTGQNFPKVKVFPRSKFSPGWFFPWSISTFPPPSLQALCPEIFQGCKSRSESPLCISAWHPLLFHFRPSFHSAFDLYSPELYHPHIGSLQSTTYALDINPQTQPRP